MSKYCADSKLVLMAQTKLNVSKI